MDATMILIDSDAELVRARALVDRLWSSNDPTDIVRLEAQARLIAAYEERKWPHRPPSLADLIRHLMDQHGLTRADMVPILGTPSRVSEVLSGKKGLSMAMVQRLRARFRVPADLLIPPPRQARRTTKRAAAWNYGDRITVTVMDCTPGMRHDNFCDSAVAMMRYRALFCANAVSNSRGDWYPSAECSRSLL